MDIIHILFIKAIHIAQSKFFFYLIIFFFTASNMIYRKIAKDIRYYLNITEHMFSGEIWEMIKEESRKGNKKAKVAFVAYYLDMLCLFFMICIILSMNI